MRTIQLRTIGKAQEPWHAQAIHSYLTRLSPFAKVGLLELPEGHGKSAKPDPTKTRQAEAVALLKNLPKSSTVIALDEHGPNLDVPTFSKKYAAWTEGGRPLVMLVGGSWGLDQSVLERADATLSFGKQTLPHLLARIVLLEQLYRAETVLHGKTYHK